MNTKLHTLCDNLGRPVRLLITEGQRSDFKGADVLLKDLPRAKALLGDKGYDSDKIRAMLAAQDITPCIPPKKNRKTPIGYCQSLYKTRHKVENLFAKRKTGGASLPDMTDAPTCSVQQSISLQPSYSGYES